MQEVKVKDEGYLSFKLFSQVRFNKIQLALVAFFLAMLPKEFLLSV
jgi:hypothetical protein